MKKMIGVINDNLCSVINGIKEHRKDAENNLSVVKNDIDEKLGTASIYKSDVEKCRDIITSLETEISDLEKDLKELNDKFGAKDFKEILAAGDKEINTKIIEKRASISEQNDIMADITKKAHILKRDLARLRDKKAAIEEDLSKTVILENYYEKRIKDIIDYSVEHPDDLASYKEIDEVENLSTSEIEDINIDNIIDGQVFNEIDSISSGENIDPETIQSVLNEENNLELIDENNNEDEEILDPEDEVLDTDLEENGNEDLEENDYLTDLDNIDDILNKANEIIDDDVSQDTESITSKIEQDVMDSLDESEENLDFNLEESEDDQDSSDENGSKPEIDFGTINLNILDDLEKKPIDSNLIESGVHDHMSLHTMSEPITVELDGLNDNQEEETEVNNNWEDDMRDCGLNKENFDPEDLKLLESHFDKSNTLEFIKVLESHGYNKDKIYNSVGVLLDVIPSDLDKLLTMLEGVADKNDIDYIFRYLNKINIDKLEQNIQTSNDESLTQLLKTALIEENNADLSNLLDISEKDVANIMKNSSDDYELMINFPEIVLANYNTLKKYNVDNSEECIVKYPHRFTFNPSKFAAILDKYDVEDLVRCINKNAAVIDKL